MMKRIVDLKNPDIIEINGYKFQVINNTCLKYDRQKEELVMVVELVKLGEKQITPNYRLTYLYHNPDKMSFFAYNYNTHTWKEKKINSLSF